MGAANTSGPVEFFATTVSNEASNTNLTMDSTFNVTTESMSVQNVTGMLSCQ